MTVPPGMRGKAQKVSDYVRNMVPFIRKKATAEELDLGVHLRGNEGLHESLQKLIHSRIEGRARLSLPSTPSECMISMARDREAQWIQAKLQEVYLSPVMQEIEQEGEQPG